MGDWRIDRDFRRFRRRGDVEALGRVFDAAAPELGRISRFLTRDAAEAEDVLQATFLTAIEKAERFDEERRFLPWATGILAGHARNARRRRRPDEGEERLAEVPAADDAARDAADAELREAVESALADLAPTVRAVVGPALTEGARPAEIAARLGISPGAARVRLHRGLARLRAVLPAGFAAAAALHVAPRGLGAVRAEVLGAAGRSAAASVGAVATGAGAATFKGLVIGGALVTQRGIGMAAAALALAGGVLLWRPWAAPGAAEPRAALTPERGPAELVESTRETAVAATAAVERETVPGPPSTATLVAGPRYVGLVRDLVTDAPISSARLLVTPVGMQEPELRATADGAGAFELFAEAEEIETLVVEADGFATWRAPRDPARRTWAWARVERENAPREGGEEFLGTIELIPALSLSARVERANSGAPVANADVLVLWQPWNDLPEVLDDRPIGRSDERGVVLLDGPVPARSLDGDQGNLLLFAVAADGVGWTRVPASPSGAVEGEVVIELHPALRLDTDVRDEQGAPVPDARVSAVPLVLPFARKHGFLRERGWMLLPWPEELGAVFEAVAGSDGHAVLPRLLPGLEDDPSGPAYDVLVEADGFLPWNETVRFAGGESATREVVLARPRDLRISGRVVDAEGAPLAGADVTLSSTGGDGELRTLTGADGAFEHTWPAAAARTVRLEARLDELEPRRETLDLEDPDTNTEGLVLTLLAGAPVAGLVVDQHGQPVEGAGVSLARPDTLEMPDEGHQRTDSEGAFRFARATEGEWLVIVSPPHPWTDWASPEENPHVRGGDEALVVVLERREAPPAELVAEFRDALSGAPIDPSSSMLIRVGEYVRGAYEGPTRAAGELRWRVIVPGRFVLFAAAPGYANGIAHVDVPPGGGEVRLRVELGDAAALRVRLDGGEQPLPERANVRAHLVNEADSFPGNDEWKEGSQLYASGRADVDGAVLLERLTPGEWELVGDARGLWFEPLRVVVAPGETREVVLPAELGAVLELVPEVSPGGGWVMPAILDQTGEWVETGFRSGSEDPPVPIARTLPPGEIRWRVRFLEQPGDGQPRVARDQEGAVTLEPGETQRVVVPVEPAD